MNTTNLIEDLRLLSPPDYAVWRAVAVLVVAVAGAFLLIRLRRSPNDAVVPDNRGPAAWDLALAELERLTPLLQREHARDYAIASTRILRRYIEERYALRAPKLATEEFLSMCVDSPAIPQPHQASLKRYLEFCDLLKFGRFVAATSELVALHEAAVNFVLASRPASAPEAGISGGPPASPAPPPPISA